MRVFRLFGIALLMVLFVACSDSATGPENGGGENGNGGGESPSYNVSVNVSPSEGGSVSTADTTVEEGEEVEIHANASDNYNFTHWDDDVDSSDANPLSLTVDQDYSVAANFKLKSYQLTVKTEGQGSVTEEVLEQKSKEYEHGTVVELVANPSENWKFVKWKGAITGSENPAEVTVESPKEVTAVFAKKEYTLTVETDGEGAVAEEVVQQKSSNYEAGTVVELTANAAKGWYFNEWSGSESISGSSSNPLEVTVDKEKTATALFLRETYELSVSNEGNGTVSKIPDQQTYKYNETVKLEANPADGYQFKEWKGDISSTENPVNVTVNTDKSITAVFEKATYKLTVNTEGEGSVTEEKVQAKSYEDGTVVRLTADPDQGWTFEKWTGDLTGSENPAKITVEQPKEVTAVFNQNKINLTNISSNRLQGNAGSSLPIEIRVVDQSNNGVSDVSVSYTITQGEGSVSPTQVQTDNSGYASTTLQLPDGMKSTTVKAEISSSAYPIGQKEIEFKAETITALDKWLNNHDRIAKVITWRTKPAGDTSSTKKWRPYKEWPNTLKGELGDIYTKVVNNNIGTDQYPPENQYEQPYNSSYPTFLKEEDAKRLHLMNVAQSIAVERNNVVSWSILSNDYTLKDLRVLFDGRVMFRYSDTNGFKVTSSRKDEGGDGWTNFVDPGYGRVMPSHPKIAMEFFQDANILGDTRKETVYRLVDWSVRMSHYTGSFSDQQNIVDHWHYRGAVPVDRIINGTDYKGDDVNKVEHHTAGCHGTNDFYTSVLRNLNIPVRYVRKGGHATPYFTVDNIYLSHGDDPYNQMYARKPAIHPKKLLISQQTWNNWFANKSYDEAQQNIGRQTTELGLEHLSYYLLGQYCDDKSRDRSKENGDVLKTLDRFYTLSELKNMDLWKKMDDKLSQIGGCESVDRERPPYYDH